MIRIIKVLLVTAVFLAGVSCTEDTLDGGGTLPPVPEGYVRASIATNVSENEQVKTRATDVEEKAYDEANVWVLMFNATSAADAAPTTIVQAPVKATQIGAKLYALLRATAQPVTVYVVAGLTASQNTYLGTASNFTEGTTTYAAISTGAQLQTPAVTAAGIPIGGTSPVDYIPMSTDRISYPGGTTTLTEIAANFRRIAAKIDIDASVLDTDDFTLEGVTLANGAQKGFVLPQTTLPSNNGGVMLYTEKSDVASNKILAQVYLYENRNRLDDNTTANPTIAIVKGSYKNGASSYYRMDLHVENPAGSGTYVPCSIERNKHYTINITEIQNGGYASLNEAINNKPSNAKYTVTVTDPDSHDIVSNGEYYIGVSNSEFVVYGDGALSNLVAVTVIHNAPNTVTTNSISVGGGLTAVTIVLAAPNNMVRTTDILVTLPAEFTTSSTGTITIKLGNLTKTIKVTRKAQFSPVGGVFDDFNSTDYVFGTVENAGTGNWLKLSAQPDGSAGTSAANNTITSPRGGIYITAPENMPTSGGTVRTGAVFYVSRRTDQGRVRVAALQGFINMDTPPTNPLTRMYVGAFWRANQMGERLIRMQVNANNLGAWSAKVMDGADWILLDTQQSLDPNIGWKSGANESLVADMNTQDASYRLSGSATSVSGAAVAVTDYIYFRIGLKSAYTATTAAPARYARVLVLYNNNTKAQVLYLRQGEEADYLMRPGDSNSGSVAVANNRLYARKFSPYNLTDLNMGIGGGNLTDHNKLAIQGGTFTQYPTQAGAFFQWATSSPDERRAYHPVNSTGSLTNWQNDYVNTYWTGVDNLEATHETCPSGYRRPTDGATDVNTTTNVALSETRQSLWLNPPTSANSDITNSVWGYYADGFFDRRSLVTTIYVPNGVANTVVSVNASNFADPMNKNIACIGRLFFNPFSGASLFFPAPGIRHRYGVANGAVQYTGLLGVYWSSSAVSFKNGASFDIRENAVYNPILTERNYGHCIRCVRP